MQAADLASSQPHLAKAPAQNQLRMMPGLFGQDAHGVGECQRCPVVRKRKAARDAACRRVKFPVAKLGEIGRALLARERLHPATAWNTGTLRERNRRLAHSFTLLRSRPGCPTDNRLHPSYSVTTKSSNSLRSRCGSSQANTPDWLQPDPPERRCSILPCLRMSRGH